MRSGGPAHGQAFLGVTVSRSSRPLQSSDLMRPQSYPIRLNQRQDPPSYGQATCSWDFDEAAFKTAYEAFSRTRTELFGTAHAPELNSKIQRDIDRAAGEQ